MALKSKIQIPDGTWTLTGDAALVSDAIKVAAAATYEDNFESYNNGDTPTGWVQVLGTLDVQTQGGQKCLHLSNPGLWMGGYYNPTDFDSGCIVAECVAAPGGRYNLIHGYNAAVQKGYICQLLPGSQDVIYAGGMPPTFIGGGLPAIVFRGYSAENPATPFVVKRHKHVRDDGNVELRGWIAGDLKYDVLDVYIKHGANKLAVQGYSGDAYYGYIKFFEIKTGGFSKTFTPYSVTSLNRIGISYRVGASLRKTMSEIFEYNVDGGGWSAIPDDGLIDVAAATSIGIRANSTLENDFDASDDLYIDAIEIEIDGEWDAPIAGPSAPSDLAVAELGNTAAILTWTDIVGGVYYRIYQNTVNDFASASMIGFALQGEQNLEVINLIPGDTYYFWIVTVNSSDDVSDTPGGPANITMSNYSTVDLAARKLKTFNMDNVEELRVLDVVDHD